MLKRILLILIFTLTNQYLFANNEPALPAGLDIENKEDSSPVLPAGLDIENKEDSSPALPAGLDDNTQQNNNQDPNQKQKFLDIQGFIDLRAGYRLQNDPNQQDQSLGELRLQLELEKTWQNITFHLTTDLYYDTTDQNHTTHLEQGIGFLDLREASIAYSPFNFMDIKIGRQILTWGTGDMLFINDMFPKDWQAFFIGRDTEYLKAPSEAIKTSIFTEIANIDLVYSPRFDTDRFINGNKISYWNGQQLAGEEEPINTQTPEKYWQDDELSLRISKNIKGYECAIYGYWGYWKSPAGFNPISLRYLFPKLNVYGASMRGQLAGGIANIEFGYYHSKDDLSGKNPLINNSQIRYLIGYEHDLSNIAQDLTLAIQYYIEQTLDYTNYKQTLPANNKGSDEFRQLLTIRLTKLYWNQNLTCSLFLYFSPTDRDAYIRPNIKYKVNDNLAVETGANIFLGEEQKTFFGQFQDNTNTYIAIRYSF